MTQWLKLQILFSRHWAHFKEEEIGFWMQNYFSVCPKILVDLFLNGVSSCYLQLLKSLAQEVLRSWTMDCLLHILERTTPTLLENAFCSWRGRRKMSDLLLIPPPHGFLCTTLIGSVFRSFFAQGCCTLRVSLGRMEAWQCLSVRTTWWVGVVWTHETETWQCLKSTRCAVKGRYTTGISAAALANRLRVLCQSGHDCPDCT